MSSEFTTEGNDMNKIYIKYPCFEILIHSVQQKWVVLPQSEISSAYSTCHRIDKCCGLNEYGIHWPIYIWLVGPHIVGMFGEDNGGLVWRGVSAGTDFEISKVHTTPS